MAGTCLDIADPGLAQGLRALLAGRQDVAVASLKLIDFEDLRHRLGRAWGASRASVRATAERVLRAGLAEGDVAIACGDSAFLVVFAAASAEAAGAAATRIAEDIGYCLTGCRASARDMVETRVATIDPTDLLNGPDVARALDEILFSRRTRIEVPPADDGLAALGMGMLYRPIWDVRRRAVATYACVVTRITESGHRDVGEAALLAGSRSALVTEIDGHVLRRALDGLRRLADAGRRVLVACPIHFATLAAPAARDELRRIVQEARPALRRDLVLELIGMDRDVPASRILELTAPLRPFCRQLVARMRLRRPHFGPFRAAGITTVGIDLAADGGAADEARLLVALNEFGMRAHAGRMVAMAQGLESRSLVMAALGAGFVYVEGAAIHPPVASPAHVLRFEPIHLFPEAADA